jgi:hypothetical protein
MITRVVSNHFCARNMTNVVTWRASTLYCVQNKALLRLHNRLVINIDLTFAMVSQVCIVKTKEINKRKIWTLLRRL